MIVPTQFHKPVLLAETLHYIGIQKGKYYIDATVGGGGYTLEIAKRGGFVLGIDQDIQALRRTLTVFQNEGLGDYIGSYVWLENDNFVNIKKISRKYGFNEIAAIVFDLGMSSYQLDQSKKGFSFRGSEQLDMRMSAGQKLTAREIVNTYSREKLYEIFINYSEELNSWAIADAIVCARSLHKNGQVQTTDQLRNIIKTALERGHMKRTEKSKNIDAICARIFQAIRIEVNEELNNLKIALQESIQMLSAGGSLAVISYHSLEDRIVKQQFRNYRNLQMLQIVTRKPVTPSYVEMRINSRSRSAKLRIARKII